MVDREGFTELSATYGFDVGNKLLKTHVRRNNTRAAFYLHTTGDWFAWHERKEQWTPVVLSVAVRTILIELPRITQKLHTEHEDEMSLADGMAWEKENPPQSPPQAPAPENSGGSCSYYEKNVYSVALNKVQLVECKDVMTALELNHDEINMFKEIWRSAAARQGKKKEGHTALRGANKIFFFADENLKRLTQQA